MSSMSNSVRAAAMLRANDTSYAFTAWTWNCHSGPYGPFGYAVQKLVETYRTATCDTGRSLAI